MPDTATNSQHPPMPRLALTVGVVGHRPDRLPDDSKKTAAIETAVGDVLDKIYSALRIAHGKYADSPGHPGVYTIERPLISLASALAEGADRIAANAAVAHRDYILDAALPFLKEEYEKDFRPRKERGGRPVDEGEEKERSRKSIAEFRHLTDPEVARSVLELPGIRKNDDDPNDKDATRAYEAAGLTILGQSDILLTIWDGGISRGRGGTPDMLNVAARLGLPIIHVDAKAEKETCIRWGALGLHPHQVNMVEDLPHTALDEEVLRRLIDDLVKPPEDKDERASLNTYLSEPPRSFNGWFEFPALMSLFGVRWMRKTDWQPVSADALAAQYAALAKRTSSECETENPNHLALAFGWADMVATRFGQVFRSAFVTNFLFAAFAVATVAYSLVAHDIGDPKVVQELARHKIGPVSLEVLFIIAVLVITIVGRRKKWHQRWLESREIAERFRVALPLWVLGARPGFFFGPEPAWTGWYVRAIQRQQGLRAGRFDPSTLRDARATLLDVLKGQREYHETAAHRMETLGHRLERTGEVLFILTLLAALGFLAAIGLFAATAFTHLQMSPWQVFFVTAVAAGLPALGTATYGIRVIGDFEGVAERSRRMSEALGRLIAAIEHDWPEARRQTEPPNFALLRARAHAAREAMLGDVENWRLSAESRDLAIPG